MAFESTISVSKTVPSPPPSTTVVAVEGDAVNDENRAPQPQVEERREERQQGEERMEEGSVFLAPPVAASAPGKKSSGSIEKKGRKTKAQQGGGENTPKNSHRPAASPVTPTTTTSARAIPWPKSLEFVTDRMRELKRKHSRLVQEMGTLNLRIDKLFPDLVKPCNRIDPFEKTGAPRTFVWMSHRGREEMEKEIKRVEGDIRKGRTTRAAREREARQKRAEMLAGLSTKLRETWGELVKEAEAAVQTEQKALAAAAAAAGAAK